MVVVVRWCGIALQFELLKKLIYYWWNHLFFSLLENAEGECPPLVLQWKGTGERLGSSAEFDVY